MSEEAKAVQEVAKAARELKPELHQIGRFLGKILGYPLEQAGGLLGDGLAALRIEGAIRFGERVDRLMRERGMSEPPRIADLAIVVPLIEAASLEQDDELGQIFANLLINSVVELDGKVVIKSFVEIARRMSSLEAKILKAMNDAPASSVNENGMMYTSRLPNAYSTMPSEENEEYSEEISPEVKIALASLRSYGCVEGALTWGGSTMLKRARITEYGQAFIAAATAPSS